MGVPVLALVVVVAWVWLMNAAARSLSFEPSSDRAMQEAADARLPSLAWALVLILAALALARLSGIRLLGLLGLPGVVVAAVFLLAPGSNGAALVLGLLASLLAVGVTAFLTAEALARSRAAGGPDD